MSANNTSVITVRLDANQANAEAAKLDSTLTRIGKSGAAAGTAAASGLSQVDRAAKGAAVSGSQLQQVYENVVRTQGANSAAARTLAAELGIQSSATMAATAATVQKTTAEGAATGSVLAAARAEQALALAEIEATVATDGATSAFMRKTNMINVGQGPLRGYDALVQAAARSMGGIPVAAALAIPLIAALAEAFFKSNEEKSKSIKLDQDQIVLDAQRHVSLNTGRLFTAEYARVLHNTSVTNEQLRASSKALSLAQMEETDAFRGSSTAIADVAGRTEDLRTKVGLYVYQLFSKVKSEKEATAARLEATATLNDQINARIRLAAASAQTRDSLVAELSQLKLNTDALRNLVAALDAGALAQARFKAGQDVLSAARMKVATDAATAGEKTLSHAEFMRRLNIELTRQGEETYILAQRTRQAEENLKAYTETRKKDTSAAKEHAQAMREEGAAFQLQKELSAAMQALGKQDFDKQRELTREEFADRRAHLLARRQLTEETSLLLVALELAALTKINNAEIENYQKEAERRGKDVEERNRQMDQQRNSRERMVKEYQRNIEQQIKLERDFTAAIQEEEGKRAKEILRQATENATARNLARKFLFSQGQDASSGGVDRFLSQLKELGPAFADVDTNANRTRAAIDYVRNAFDFASDSSEMFQLKLDLLTGKSVTFGQTMTAIFSEMFLTVQGATAFFQGFGQTISSVFEGIVTGTGNAKAAFLNFIAGLLMQLGQAAIAMGSIYLFMPGFQGLGIGLIAAGVAAMALGGVLRGLASNAQKSESQGAGGASASGGGGAGASRGNGQPPTVISFPTSPASQPQTVVIALDKGGTRDFLDGKGVVTMGQFRGGRGASPEMTRKIRKMAKA